MIPWVPSEADMPIKDGITETLTLKGLVTTPPALNVGGIQPTYDVGAGGFAAGRIVTDTANAASIAAVTSASFLLIAPIGFTLAGALNTPNISLNKENARVLGVGTRVTFDAAGAAAFAGKEVHIQYELRALTNSPNWPVWTDRFTAAAAILNYRRQLDSNYWKGLVPYQLALSVSIVSADGTAFPANTTWGYTGGAYWIRKAGAIVPS